jgi:misacylated tRNA(Ala) deacylase
MNAPQNSDKSKKDVDPRMHSAEHILTATLLAIFGCARPFTTHLEKKKSKADYHYSRELTPDEIEQVEARVNEVIAKNLPVWEEFLTRAQAEKVYDLARLPETAGQTIRIVHIGDYDACPCSGHHVESTKVIGQFRIVSTTYETGALRVRFKLDAKTEAAD